MCVYLYIAYLCLTVHMCICLGRRGGQMDKGMLIKGVFKGHPVLTLSPHTPSWLRISVYKKTKVKRYEEWTPLPPPFSPCPPWSETKYALTLMISVYCRKKESHMSPLQRARWGSEWSSQARDHYPVGGGHVSVPWARTRAAIGAGAASIYPSYGR